MKRPWLHRLFSGFMALLVLITSVGLTVQSHTCRSSGHTTAAIVFSAPKHQCPPAKPASLLPASHQVADQVQLKQSCCDFGAHFHKLEAAAHNLELAKQLLSHVALPGLSVASWAPFSGAAHLTQAAPWHASDSSPPLRGGRALLAFACTWRV